jgi:hypothetical protein
LRLRKITVIWLFMAGVWLVIGRGWNPAGG